MKLFIALCLVATVVADFEEFQKKHGKKYKDAEHAKRAEGHFKRHQKRIDEHNAKFAAGEVSYSIGENQFADQNITEVIAQICGHVIPKDMRSLATAPWIQQDQASFPAGAASKDWTSIMQPIANQGSCGSCWAFATVAQLESLYKRNSPVYNYVMSPQYLVDCDNVDGGCNGGYPPNAMNFIMSNGIPLASNYAYQAVRGTCKAYTSIGPKLPTQFNSYTLNGNEVQLKNIVAQDGPVVVGMTAGTDSFMFYKTGVIDDPKCSTSCTTLNHAVVVVGYGTDSATGKDYWLVRNSWGTTWGAGGYVKIARGKNNMCGLACSAFYFKK